MPAKTIQIYRLDDSEPDFSRLFRLWRDYQEFEGELEFDFSLCPFLGQGAVAFLGGFARQLEARGCAVRFLVPTLRQPVRANLAQNGFLRSFGHAEQPWDGNSIPYRQDAEQDPRGFANYLEQMWLGKNWVRVSDALRNAIVSRLSEAYLNVFDHAKSGVGICSCGQHFPTKHELKLTLVDFGVGIPSNVRLFFLEQHGIAPETLPAAACMEWAFQKGSSTRPGGRGLGLDLLRSFVEVNDGQMEIFSHDGHAKVTKQGVEFRTLPVYFEGTLVNILLRCDETHYCLASEREHPF
ncbi:MAG: hypothetical protein WC003_03670 [Terrimicrobiaceae bacterium]